MTLIPTKIQWSSWNLPTRLAALGTLFGLIALVFAAAVYWFPVGKTNFDEEKSKVSHAIYELEYILRTCKEDIEQLIEQHRYEGAERIVDVCSQGKLNQSTTMTVELNGLRGRVFDSFSGTDQFELVKKIDKMASVLQEIRHLGIKARKEID